MIAQGLATSTSFPGKLCKFMGVHRPMPVHWHHGFLAFPKRFQSFHDLFAGLFTSVDVKIGLQRLRRIELNSASSLNAAQWAKLDDNRNLGDQFLRPHRYPRNPDLFVEVLAGESRGGSSRLFAPLF